MKGYIYRFTNLLNDKVYIGQTIDIEYRYKDHLYLAEHGSKQQIHQALRKYGIHNFRFEVLHEISIRNTTQLKLKLDILEKQEILAHNSYKIGYNASLGGEGNLGLVHSEETKKVLSEKSRNRSPESNKKISDAKKGKPSSRKGCTLSEETKRKISDSKKGRPPWNKGLRLVNDK